MEVLKFIGILYLVIHISFFAYMMANAFVENKFGKATVLITGLGLNSFIVFSYSWSVLQPLLLTV